MKTVNSKFTTPIGDRSDVAAGSRPKETANSYNVRKSSWLF